MLVRGFFLSISFLKLRVFTRRSPNRVGRFDNVRVSVSNRRLVNVVLYGDRHAFVVINRIRAVFRLNLYVNDVDVRAGHDVRRLQVILANLLSACRLFRAEREARQVSGCLASVAIAARRGLAFNSVANVVEGDVHGVTS